jgi:hypothetical protein
MWKRTYQRKLEERREKIMRERERLKVWYSLIFNNGPADRMILGSDPLGSHFTNINVSRAAILPSYLKKMVDTKKQDRRYQMKKR